METSGYMQVLEEKKSPPNPLIRQRYTEPFVVRECKDFSPTEKKEIKVLLAAVGPRDVDAIAAAYNVDRATIDKIRYERTRKRAKPSAKKKTSNKR